MDENEDSAKRPLLDVLAEISKLWHDAEQAYDAEAEEFWTGMSKEDQLKAFYSVVKRIHQGDLVEKGSYRYVLYQVFGFDMDSYVIGMQCGYMALHNAIVTDENPR